MTAIHWTILCCAYLVGLVLTAIPQQVLGISLGAIAAIFLGIGLAIGLPLVCKSPVKPGWWVVAGVVGLLAVLYFQWQMPEPGADDISRWLHRPAASPQLTVQGIIGTSPRLTRSQRIQFQLHTTAVSPVDAGSPPEPVSGNLYITVPLLQGTGLYLGQEVQVIGSLYEPKPATNPGGFSFQAYLAQQGMFAGFSGQQVNPVDQGERSPSLFQTIQRHIGQVQGWIQRRIVRSQVQGLGIPEGPLVSAMVMGRNGVDLDYDLRDQFSRSGLAHALAASGFQVSLLIGVLLTLAERLTSRQRLWLGTIVILAYVGLTGIQPAVLRAGIMGWAALLGMTIERKVKPLGALLMAATLLLVFNPLWIWDLGFQFSFLATLGLLVTAPVVTKWLDWVPAAIAPAIAVPVAAYVWTVPLQLLVFGVVSPYSIAINVITTPIITLLSIGGMVSALAALLYSPAGSILAGFLYYPAHGLMELAAWGNQLPGNAFAVGTIAIPQMVMIYGLMGVIWWRARWQRYWWIALIAGISLVAIPAWHIYYTTKHVTVLATAGEPVVVIQNRGKVLLFNISNEATVHFTVLPFLQQQGINQIDWAIAPSLPPGNAAPWFRLLHHLPIRQFYGDPNFPALPQTSRLQLMYQPLFDRLQLTHASYAPLNIHQPLTLNEMQVQLMQTQPAIVQLQFDQQTWLLLPRMRPEDQLRVKPDGLPSAQVLVWAGDALPQGWLDRIQPEVAIATSGSIPAATDQWLHQHSATGYATEQDGAVQWTETQEFRSQIGEER